MTDQPKIAPRIDEDGEAVCSKECTYFTRCCLTTDPELPRIEPLPVDYDSFDETAKPIWEVVAEMGAEISDSEWAGVPRDLAINHDHYLYGASRVKR